MYRPYLDTCIETARSIDSLDIAARLPGDLVGIAGSGYCFKQLGQLTLVGSVADYIGLKIPRLTERGVVQRTHYDLAFIGMQTQLTPQLDQYFPSFINLVKVEDSQAIAVLMEDVSQGGQHEVWGAPATNHAREMLYRPYVECGAIDEVLDHRELDRTTSFDVGGREFLLDLVPSPINLKYLRLPSLWKSHSEAVYDALPALTITIPQNTPLGSALLNPGPENY